MKKKLSISVDNDKIIVSYTDFANDKKIEIGMNDKLINGEEIFDCFFSDIELDSEDLLDFEFISPTLDSSKTKAIYIVENIKNVFNIIKDCINQEKQNRKKTSDL